MGDPPAGTPTFETPPEERLDSWKEIAAYLHRDVTTVQRWEKREGMPVHRHVHDKRGSVYALPAELDAWVRSRRQSLEEEEKVSTRQSPVDADGDDLGNRATPWVRRWVSLIAVSAAALLAIGYLALRGRNHGGARLKITSLAVLPLKNLSGDPTQDYLADGMTEALIGRLAGIHDLRVVSHTSVMRFRNPQVSVPEIARMLGVDALVEGSVMRDGSRIRVTAQLIRGETDEHFWSETYDREARDVLALQSEIAQSIAKKVQVTVTGAERERLTAAHAVAPEVYESYLKGRFALSKANSKGEVEEGIGYLEDALKKDPTFAPAYVGVADAYGALGTVFMGVPPAETRPKVISAARKALELDANLSEAHVLLADAEQEQWQWAEAETEYRRALDLNPNDANAHYGLAMWLACQGRTEEALAWVRRGRELDPVAISGSAVGWILFLSHRYDEGIRETRSELAVQADNAGALLTLGFALIANNQAKEAIPALEKAVSVSNRSPAVIGVLIRGYAHAGRRSDALQLLEELKRRREAGYVPAGAFVNAYLGLGETELAFVWFEQAYKEQSNILQFLKVHPFFDAVRGDARFTDLVRRVGLG
jgi:pentatricopeptide repeat protein